MFPLLDETEYFKTHVFEIVPQLPIDTSADDIWDSQENAYNFIGNDCLIENEDLHKLVSKLYSIIRRCELTHQSLKLKLEMASNKENNVC